MNRLPFSRSLLLYIYTPLIKLLEIKNRKAAQYQLTSPIFYMEHYIPFSLTTCESFSQILETLYYIFYVQISRSKYACLCIILCCILGA